MSRQKLISEETLNWDRIYINFPRNKVIIFKDKKCETVKRVLPLDKFNKLLKRVPSINLLIQTLL